MRRQGDEGMGKKVALSFVRWPSGLLAFRLSGFPVLVCALILPVAIFGCSKRSKDLYTIGVFQFNSNPLLDDAREGFTKALKDVGYENDINIRLDFKNAQGDISTSQLIARKFVQDEVDMICAISTPCLQSAINTTEKIPIIFGAIANPYRVGAGQDSVNHRANVTGASSPSPIRAGMRLLLEVMPDAKRVGTLWNPTEENSQYDIERARNISEELGLELVDLPVTASSDVLMSAQALAEKDIDAIFQIIDNVVCSSIESEVKVANEVHIPLFALDPRYTERGACVGIGWDYFKNGYKSGKLAVRVMNGEKPAEIPFQELEEVKLHINLKVAELQGVSFPKSILERADKRIEWAQLR